jgi:hypothetical protein
MVGRFGATRPRKTASHRVFRARWSGWSGFSRSTDMRVCILAKQACALPGLHAHAFLYLKENPTNPTNRTKKPGIMRHFRGRVSESHPTITRPTRPKTRPHQPGVRERNTAMAQTVEVEAVVTPGMHGQWCAYVRCPFCSAIHKHGAGPKDAPPSLGPRGSHCVEASGDYVLVPAPPGSPVPVDERRPGRKRSAT